MKRRILLASIHVGGGHNALRDSFHTVLRAADPAGQRFEPIVFDSQDTRVERFYKFVVRHIPWFQGVIYRIGNSNAGVRLGTLAASGLLREAKQALLTYQPDVVLSTHLLVSQMFAKARLELDLPIPVVSAIPDYGPATPAFCPSQVDLKSDHYIVMDDGTRAYLKEERGTDSHWSGFLPRAPFRDVSAQFEPQGRLPAARRQALWAELSAEHPQLSKLNPALPTLIFLGGSAWTEKTRPVLDRLLADEALRDKLNFVVVAGANEVFHQEIRALAETKPRLAPFGFVSPTLMAQLIALSDVPVLGSLAPATMQELLELRCGPLMLFHFIPGTEGPHVSYIRDQRIGVYEPDPEQMVQRVLEVVGLAKSSEEIAQLRGGFLARAAEIRAQNIARAFQLPSFLEQAQRVVPLRQRAQVRELGALERAS